MSRPCNTPHSVHPGGGSSGRVDRALLKARGLGPLPALLPLPSSGPAPPLSRRPPLPGRWSRSPGTLQGAATHRRERRAEGRGRLAGCGSTPCPSSRGRPGRDPRARSSPLTCSAAVLRHCLRSWQSARRTRRRRRPRPRPAPAPPPPRRRRYAPRSTSGPQPKPRPWKGKGSERGLAYPYSPQGPRNGPDVGLSTDLRVSGGWACNVRRPWRQHHRTVAHLLRGQSPVL